MAAEKYTVLIDRHTQISNYRAASLIKNMYYVNIKCISIQL